jgi:hypothetical protein
MHACAAASISRRCLAASIAHYSSFTARTSRLGVGSSATPLGGSLPAALQAAQSIFERNLPQAQTGVTYVLPAGAAVSVFEEKWLGGGAAAEVEFVKVGLPQHS